ncbi:hypothetical protein ACOHPB_003139 [Cronobacter sakazakii]|uniref:hypothetical protein n=1 Tax=Cronobacter sakazakii TaxID=28141 RepID=UPI000B4B5384|nr:hypothetical protein [Cronobacter sakazakii]EKY2038249.1 hypothetical protein [Cronobacter sakazakii]ELY4471609.1 hypothetical protein [Cronobacter sakazakii]PUW46555.1 hypothetical protein AUN05_06535 [Cronobacter sakazakii]HAU5500041.1 hypothetical protein [Cronobacter sakazakii]
MDKSREQFEKWMSDNGKHPLAIEKMDKNYILATTRTQWEAWQASRAAVEIELPSELSLKKFACSDCIGAVLEAVENHVLAAGLKVKGG